MTALPRGTRVDAHEDGCPGGMRKALGRQEVERRRAHGVRSERATEPEPHASNSPRVIPLRSLMRRSSTSAPRVHCQACPLMENGHSSQRHARSTAELPVYTIQWKTLQTTLASNHRVGRRSFRQLFKEIASHWAGPDEFAELVPRHGFEPASFLGDCRTQPQAMVAEQ
jgi:hypothetical protein